VDFKNTIIILTSNLGSELLLGGIRPDGSIAEEVKAAIQQELSRMFRPEFLNRLDEIIFYKPLTKPEITRIIDLQTEKLSRRLEDQQLTLKLTDRARQFVADNAYDPAYGARPLKRFIQSKVETLVGKLMLQGVFEAGSSIVVDVEDGALAAKKG